MAVLFNNSESSINGNGTKQRPKLIDGDSLLISFGRLIDVETIEGKNKAYFLLTSIGLGRIVLPGEILSQAIYKNQEDKPYTNKYSISSSLGRSLALSIDKDFWIAFNSQATSSVIEKNQIVYDKTRLISVVEGLENLKDLLVALEMVKASSSSTFNQTTKI